MAEHTELEKIRIEKEKLELENLSFQVENEKNRRAEKAQRSIIQELTQKGEEAARQRRQAQCNHRKGGINVEGLISGRGNDERFSVNKQTVPDGTTYVLCTRCGKEWWPKDKEYVTAMNWPTDNIPSQSITFNVHA